jgi:hypothetical protein
MSHGAKGLRKLNHRTHLSQQCRMDSASNLHAPQLEAATECVVYNVAPFCSAHGFPARRYKQKGVIESELPAQLHQIAHTL